METVNEALGLLRRQVELEMAMKQPGGIRITEEQELLVLRRRLASYPQAMQAVVQARRMRYAVRSRKLRLKMWNPGLARTPLE
jgi:hypothetical protein